MNLTKCKIADFNISFDSKIKNMHILMRNYLFDFSIPDIFLTISNEDIRSEKDNCIDNFSEGSIQRLSAFRKFAELIPKYNAFVLHCACFDVEGEGVAFAAHSGTGKTTHMNLWQKYLGNKMTIVNGDKPIVRFFDGEPNVPYAYGTPWNGKEHLGCNMRTELKHICFIERSETNYVEKVDKKAVIERILKQVYIPTNSVALTNTMQLVDRLLSVCDLWIIHCNMDIEAAEVAYNTIFGKK